MISHRSRTTLLALIFCSALPAWGQNYLYTPQPVAAGQKATAEEAILVQEIEVRKGDSLYGLSRKYSGHGMYYPQILLFNQIKKPHLIHPGDILKIPVAQKDFSGEKLADETARNVPAAKKTAPAPTAKPAAKTAKPATTAITSPSALPSDLTLHELKAVGVATGNDQKKRKAAVTRKAAAPEATAELHTKQSPTPHGTKGGKIALAPASTGQKIFEDAVKAYRRGECRSAIDLLDRYLADNSASPLAADATLYRADCYLKLSSP